VGFEGIAISLIGTTIIFFHLYSLFKERSSEEAAISGMTWTRIINENLSNLFFGLGLVMIDVLLNVTWLFAEFAAYPFTAILRTTSLLVLFLTIAVAIIMLLKVAFVFLQMFFEWAIEKVGLMK